MPQCGNRAGRLSDMISDDTEQRGAIGETTTDALAQAVSGLLAAGLPVDETAAPTLLLDLRSVYARSVVPSQRRSRLQALNELLPRLISGLGDPVYREGVQALMGLAPGTRGTLLTSRRRQAAEILGYSAAHLRTDIEPKLVRAVASLLHDDLLRYAARVKRSIESLEPTGDTPRLGPEHINHEEELISRIWQHVYGLRAETIALLRLGEIEGEEKRLEEHRQAVHHIGRALHELLDKYSELYGPGLIRHGVAEYSREALDSLAEWTLL